MFPFSISIKVKELFGWLNDPWMILVVGILAGLIVFLPINIIKFLGLELLRENQILHAVSAIIFLFCALIYLVAFLSIIYLIFNDLILKNKERKKEKSRISAELNKLPLEALKFLFSHKPNTPLTHEQKCFCYALQQVGIIQSSEIVPEAKKILLKILKKKSQNKNINHPVGSAATPPLEGNL